MKKILIFFVLIIACIGFYISFYFYIIPNQAQSTFEQKKDSLHLSIKRQIKDAWNNDNALLFFKEYGGATYLRMDMDAVRLIDSRVDSKMPPFDLAWDLFPIGRYDNFLRMTLESLQPGRLDDLYDLYYIQNIPWRGTFVAQDGDSYNIKITTLSPILVGYKRAMQSYRNYRPSFDKCCLDTKEYLQTEDTNLRMYYNPQNEDRVTKIFNLRNDYYYFQFNNLLTTVPPGNPLLNDIDFANFDFHNHDKYAFPFGEVSWIFNDFYKVYYYSCRTGNMNLTFNDTKFCQDVESYISEKRQICNVVFIICVGILIILIAISYFRRKKTNAITSNTNNNIKNNTKNEDIDKVEQDPSELYDKIVKLSNPELFIKPYQPEKLEIANRIYSTAIKNKDNILILNELLEEALTL